MSNYRGLGPFECLEHDVRYWTWEGFRRHLWLRHREADDRSKNAVARIKRIVGGV